jgi:predicted porin
MRRICTAVLLGTTAFSVHAQSTVTLYGTLDSGISYANNAQTGKTDGVLSGRRQIALTDGAIGFGNRWGLKGTEDLGGGQAAIFVIENGFGMNTGVIQQGGAEFGRQAWVGLSNNLGTVTLGRQYDSYIEAVQLLSVLSGWPAYIGTHPDDVDNLANTNRTNNSVKFRTASISGLRLGAMYSFGGVAGNFTQNQIWSLGANYSAGPLSLGAGYFNARDPNVSFYGNTPNKGSATANNLGSFGSATTAQGNPVFAGYASAKTTQIIGVGASYAFGATTVGAVVTNPRFESLGSSSGPNPLKYTGSANFINAELSVKTRITPSVLLVSAFDYTKRNSVNDDGGAKYYQLDFEADYSLSKRTDIYALAVLQRASGRDSLGQPAVASITGFSPSATNKQLGFRLALLHKF